VKNRVFVFPLLSMIIFSGIHAETTYVDAAMGNYQAFKKELLSVHIVSQGLTLFLRSVGMMKSVNSSNSVSSNEQTIKAVAQDLESFRLIKREWDNTPWVGYRKRTAMQAKWITTILKHQQRISVAPCQNTIDRYSQHSCWYADAVTDTPRAMIFNHVVYPVCDIAIDKGSNALVSKSSRLQKVVALLPQREKQFIEHNGKLVVAAGVTRAIDVLSKADNTKPYSQHTKAFAAQAAVQLGCTATEEYIVKPVVESCGLGYYTKVILNTSVVMVACQMVIAMKHRI